MFFILLQFELECASQFVLTFFFGNRTDSMRNESRFFDVSTKILFEMLTQITSTVLLFILLTFFSFSTSDETVLNQEICAKKSVGRGMEEKKYSKP